MKTITLILIAAAGLFAQEAQEKKPQPPKASPKEGTAALPTIPAGATEVGDNLYRYTDAKGKTWMYRRTPFGVAKWEDNASVQPAVVDDPPPTTVTDLGDSYQFQRDTPFGPQKWKRKKSELTDEDKAILARPETVKPPAAGSKTTDGKAQASGKKTERP